MDTFSYPLWFAVRYVHVASVALLSGGAMLLSVLCFLSKPGGDADAAFAAAPLYEWAFWSLIGVTVVTGVSNLGLKGDGLMGPTTMWGQALTMKLAAALLLLALSLVRSDFVIRCSAVRHAGASDRARAILGSLYGTTVAVLLGALWIGLGLAHGRY
jgi:hypothetical protein